MDDAPTPPCVVCGRRRPNRGVVCDTCRLRLRVQLDELPRKLARIASGAHLVPGQSNFGERVAQTRTGSPTGARLDTLSVVGPGTAMTHTAVQGRPKMRRWCTRQTVTVDTGTGPQRRDVVTWHSEPVVDEHGRPVLVDDDDQVGIVPPAQWVAWWERRWRDHFGHARRPAPVHDPVQQAVQHPVQQAGPDVRQRQAAANAVLGLTGYVPPTERPADPLENEWQIRWGQPRQSDDTFQRIRYLTTWLDEAADSEQARIAEFAAELRALTAELTRILGDQPDQQWLGRCPAMIVARGADGEPVSTGRPCGAGLWQDPYTGTYQDGVYTSTTVRCPRCSSTWGPHPLELHRLATDIRRVWPLDRRRRYIGAELDVPRPGCITCGERVQVTWRDVTGRGDRQPAWQIERVWCTSGCTNVERTP
jgi:hypothetical protein